MNGASTCFPIESTSLTALGLSLQQRQTLFILHSDLSPGFIHSVEVSIHRPFTLPSLGKDGNQFALGVLFILFALGWAFYGEMVMKEVGRRVPPLVEGGWI